VEQTGILDQVKQVVSDTFGVSVGSLTAETTANDVEGWDSVAHLIFINGIESAFGVRLPMQQALDVSNLGDMAKLVQDVRQA
jgi:acyl carrier protein